MRLMYKIKIFFWSIPCVFEQICICIYFIPPSAWVLLYSCLWIHVLCAVQYETNIYVGFQVPTVVTIKNTVFWVVTPCGEKRPSHFRRTSLPSSWSKLSRTSNLLGLLFYLEDGCNICLTCKCTINEMFFLAHYVLIPV